MGQHKHTPGPWVASFAEPDMAEGIGHVSSRAGSYGDIATCWVDDGRAKANASLIAAAPDLLAALESELADLITDIRWSEDADLGRLVGRRVRVEAAIAKATGGDA